MPPPSKRPGSGAGGGAGGGGALHPRTAARPGGGRPSLPGPGRVPSGTVPRHSVPGVAPRGRVSIPGGGVPTVMSGLSMDQIGKWFTSLKHLDRFGYMPVYQFYKYRTQLGALFSFLTIFLLLVFVLSTYDKFVHGSAVVSSEKRVFEPPSLAREQDGSSHVTEMEERRQVTPPTVCFVFRRDDPDEDRADTFVDPSFFTFEFTQVRVQSFDVSADSVVQTPLATTLETLRNADGQVLAENAQCLNANDVSEGVLLGMFEDDLWKYIRVQLKKCIGTASSGETCSSSEDIDRTVWQSGSVQWFIQNDDGDGTLLLSFRREFVQDVQLSSDVLFQRLNVTWRARYFFDGKSRKFIVHHSNHDTFAGYNPELGVYAEWFFLMNREEVRQTRFRQTLLELLASWGGLAAFLMLVLGTSAIRWNKRNFEKELNNRDLRQLDRENFSEDGRLLMENARNLPMELSLMTANPTAFGVVGAAKRPAV